MTTVPQAIEISALRPGDAAAAGMATVAGYQQVDRGLRADYAASIADVAARAARPGWHVLVARQGDRCLGTATVVLECADAPQEQLTEDAALLRMLGVDPAAQGAGVGRALMVAAMEFARAHKRTRMILYTQPYMLAAHRLYESLGFVRVPERDWTVPNGPSLLAYELAL